MELKKAIDILESAGYVRKPLFKKPLAELKECTIDLSIVIPVYNAEDYLEKCLNSLLVQKGNCKYEVICINDGSLDGSLAILERMADKFANLVIHNQKNGGISCARNAGIALARGEYVGFVDNDDYVESDYVERIMKAARENDADIVQVGYSRITTEGNVLFNCQHGDFVVSYDDFAANFERLKGTIWAGCYKKRIFENVRFPEGYWYEDMINKILFIRLARKIVSVNDVLYYWVARPTSAMSTLWKSYNIKAVDQVYLPIALQRHVKKIENDELFRIALQKEYSYILYLRTHKLPRLFRKAIFIIVSEKLREFKTMEEDIYTPSKYRYFDVWNAVCLWHLLTTHICSFVNRHIFAQANKRIVYGR